MTWFAGVTEDLARETADRSDPMTLAGPPWWLCPNDPRCPHGQIMHDVEEHTGDGTDTCCADGCHCRGPNALSPGG